MLVIKLLCRHNKSTIWSIILQSKWICKKYFAHKHYVYLKASADVKFPTVWRKVEDGGFLQKWWIRLYFIETAPYPMLLKKFYNHHHHQKYLFVKGNCTYSEYITCWTKSSVNVNVFSIAVQVVSSSKKQLLATLLCF